MRDSGRQDRRARPSGQVALSVAPLVVVANDADQHLHEVLCEVVFATPPTEVRAEVVGLVQRRAPRASVDRVSARDTPRHGSAEVMERGAFEQFHEGGIDLTGERGRPGRRLPASRRLDRPTRREWPAVSGGRRARRRPTPQPGCGGPRQIASPGPPILLQVPVASTRCRFKTSDVPGRSSAAVPPAPA